MDENLLQPAEDCLQNDGQPEEEETPMPAYRESLTVRGPFETASRKNIYELVDGHDVVVAEVFHLDGKQALETALMLAAAPSMQDCLEAVLEWVSAAVAYNLRISDVCVEATGTPCMACDMRGQPSKMVFSAGGHAFHDVCVPDAVKKEIAEMNAAADQDGDVEF